MAASARPTINELLRDEGIAHALTIERLKNAEQAAVVAMIEDELLPHLIAQLEARLAKIDDRGIDIGPATTERLRKLIQALRESIDAWATGFSASLVERVGEVARLSSQISVLTLATVLDDLPIRVATALPTATQLRALVLERPFDGMLLEPLTERLGETAKIAFERQLRLGIAAGDRTEQIIRRVADTTGLVRNSASVLVRTGIAHAANVGRDEAFAANSHLIKGVQWVDTLDTHTCPRCAALGGQIFELGTGPRSPLHIQCRCTTAPVVKSWRELGIDIDDIPPSTRASADGQVSANLRYGDWLRRRPAADQTRALGATRAKLFRTGKLEIGDFVNREGEVITLEALRRRHAAAFEKAGL